MDEKVFSRSRKLGMPLCAGVPGRLALLLGERSGELI